MQRAIWIVLTIVLCSATALAQRHAQRFADMGEHHRPITTRSAEAQAWFDQGLALYFGFNHAEAILSFEAAAAADPDCAMAPFAIALSHGPNINNPAMEDESAMAAFESIQHALTLLDDETPVETALVRALSKRYAWPKPDDLMPLNQAYAEEMRKVHAAHPDDVDVAAWTADALMNLRPWDLWSKEGEPRPETPEIIAILERTLKLAPRHPGACHFYIHTMEASPTPEKALTAANTLRDLVPGAGHLVHMPGHIDIRLGDYPAAILANQKAIAADLRYGELTGDEPGFYTIYRAHNYHFLSYAAMFDGQKDVALQAASEVVARVPLDLVLAYPDFLDAFMAVPVHVDVRFGRWNELLAMPQPHDELLATRAFWHYGRTVALSSLGRVAEAEREFSALQAAAAAVPQTRLMGNNDALTLLDIAVRMAEGELLYRKGEHARAFELLREAVTRDDALRYDEPWGWMQPVRHALGALLLEQGQNAEAEAVYRADLVHHPRNGWALHGLEEALRRLAKAGEAAQCAQDFGKAWSRADIKIDASCYCRRGKPAG